MDVFLKMSYFKGLTVNYRDISDHEYLTRDQIENIEIKCHIMPLARSLLRMRGHDVSLQCVTEKCVLPND